MDYTRIDCKHLTAKRGLLYKLEQIADRIILFYCQRLEP